MLSNRPCSSQPAELDSASAQTGYRDFNGTANSRHIYAHGFVKKKTISGYLGWLTNAVVFHRSATSP